MNLPPRAPTTTWPFSAIRVRGLFGGREFTLTLDPGATIVTGENGSGKSTVLGAVHALAQAEWPRLLALPLDGLVLEAAGQPILGYRRIDHELEIHDAAESWTVGEDDWTPPDPRRRAELQHLQRLLSDPGLPPPRRAAVRRRVEQLRLVGDVADAPPWLADALGSFRTKPRSTDRSS